MTDGSDGPTPVYCINCGTKAKTIAKFCHACGLPVYRGTSSEILSPLPMQFPKASTPPVVSAPTPTTSSAEVPERATLLVPSLLGVSIDKAGQQEARVNIKAFVTRQTFGAVLLNAVTFGVWAAHFLNGLTGLINVSLDREVQRRQWPLRPNSHCHIPETLTVATMVLAYTSLGLVVPSVVMPENSPIQFVGDLAFMSYSSCLVIWSFKVRNRLNTLLQATQERPIMRPGEMTDSRSWLHGVPTFSLNVFYINYKLNKLKQVKASML